MEKTDMVQGAQDAGKTWETPVLEDLGSVKDLTQQYNVSVTVY